MMGEYAKKIQEFFEVNEITRKVVEPLKEGAVAWVEIEDDPQPYTLIKKGGRSYIMEGKPEKPEVYFKFSKEAIDYLLSTNSDRIEDYVERLSECMLNPTSRRWIKFNLLTTMLDAARKGYVRMVLLGGKKALKTLAALGIKIPKKLFKV